MCGAVERAVVRSEASRLHNMSLPCQIVLRAEGLLFANFVQPAAGSRVPPAPPRPPPRERSIHHSSSTCSLRCSQSLTLNGQRASSSKTP